MTMPQISTAQGTLNPRVRLLCSGRVMFLWFVRLLRTRSSRYYTY
jgi:hypothetical protein